MRLGILLCDHVQPALQAEFGDYPAMFENWLSDSPVPLDITFFSAIDGELPDNIDMCDAYMTSGSKFGVNDELPWIGELEAFITRLYHAKKPFVGICFGHQLIAKALGGKVERSYKGWGIGVSSCRLPKQSHWMQPKKNQVNLIVSHQDQITHLPPNTEVLLGDDFCPYSMIQLGTHFLGLQGHPEFSHKYCHALMKSRKAAISPPRLRQGMASLQLQTDDSLILVWLVSFLQRAMAKST